jgi:glycosyltransferase involved in cell wall biosynthesis
MQSLVRFMTFEMASNLWINSCCVIFLSLRFVLWFTIPTMSALSTQSVAFIVTRLELAGAEKQLVQIATGLSERGWQVSVLSMMPPTAHEAELRKKRVTVTTLGMGRGSPNPSYLFKAASIFRTWKPQVLCTFNYHADVLGRFAGKLAGVPVITSSIRNENFGGGFRDALIKYTNFLAPQMTTNSTLAAKSLIARGLIAEKNMRVIPNGIRLEPYAFNAKARAALRSEWGITEDEFVWLAVGRLEEQKDFKTLLQAFGKLFNGRLLVAGEGPMLGELKTDANNLGLKERVRFLGLRKDIPHVLSAVDAFVLSSAWEGLPNVVMEALAASKPVVATDVGGVRELVEENKSGFIVPAKSPDALSSAMQKLMMLMPAQRTDMGRYGFEHVKKTYSLESVTTQWEQFFTSLIQRAEGSVRSN